MTTPPPSDPLRALSSVPMLLCWVYKDQGTETVESLLAASKDVLTRDDIRSAVRLFRKLNLVALADIVSRCRAKPAPPINPIKRWLKRAR